MLHWRLIHSSPQIGPPASVFDKRRSQVIYVRTALEGGIVS